MKKNNQFRLKPNLKKILSQVPPDYYEKGIKTNTFQFIWHGWKWLTMRQILTKLSPTPKKILDIGCSAGHITVKIAKLFPEAKVYGLDVHDQAIKLGKKIHPQVQFKAGNAEKLPFKAESFDLVTCVETLEHLENPAKALTEIARVLKKAGSLLVGQDTDSLFFKLIWFFWTKTRGKVWIGSHIHSLPWQSLAQLIEKSGFKIKLKKFSQAGLEVFFLARRS